MNGVLQDRLVKALRLAGIADLERANLFMDGKYLPAFHRRFARVAASPTDGHRAVPRHWNEVLNWEEERVVQRDRPHEALSLVRRPVIVRILRDGRVQLVATGATQRGKRAAARRVDRAHPHCRAERRDGFALPVTRTRKPRITK